MSIAKHWILSVPLEEATVDLAKMRQEINKYLFELLDYLIGERYFEKQKS